MKKTILALSALLLTTAALASPPPFAGQAQFIIRNIVVQPGQIEGDTVDLIGDNLAGVKVCLSFDGPVKHVEAKGSIWGPTDKIWYGTTSQDCSNLEILPFALPMKENPELKIECRNFDAVARTCKIKFEVYTTSNVEPK